MTCRLIKGRVEYRVLDHHLRPRQPSDHLTRADDPERASVRSAFGTAGSRGGSADQQHDGRMTNLRTLAPPAGDPWAPTPRGDLYPVRPGLGAVGRAATSRSPGDSGNATEPTPLGTNGRRGSRTPDPRAVVRLAWPKGLQRSHQRRLPPLPADRDRQEHQDTGQRRQREGEAEGLHDRDIHPHPLADHGAVDSAHSPRRCDVMRAGCDTHCSRRTQCRRLTGVRGRRRDGHGMVARAEEARHVTATG